MVRNIIKKEYEDAKVTYDITVYNLQHNMFILIYNLSKKS